MAKNDSIAVTMEIGGKLEKFTIKVEQNGGSLEARAARDAYTVEVLNKNNRPTGRKYTFAPQAIRSIEENLSRG